MKNLGYYNGTLGEIEEISIPMGDRVCFFGDGVYDATYSRNYIIFTLDEHVDRFFNSAALLDMELPCTKEELKDLLNELVHKMDTGENFVYFQATRGTDVVRNHVFDDGVKANLWVNIFHRDIIPMDRKMKLVTAEDTRFLHCNIKTVNLLPAVMASRKAKDLGCDETVFHRNGRVTECAHSNVHILKDGKFITAPTDNLILPGIARKHLINACHRLGVPVEERPYMLDELYDADEVLVSSAGSLGLATDELDGKPCGGKALELLAKIQQAVLEEFMEQTTV